MGKKKILFIMTSLGGGGAEKVLLTMLKNFDYTQFDVSLCVISNTGAYLNEVPSQVHLVPIYQSPNSLQARIGFNLYSKLRCTWVERFSARRAIKEHYDTIISFCEGRSVKFHGYLMDRAKRNISWVHCDLFTMHYTVGPVLSANDEKRLYEAMDEVVFVSKESREQFKKLGYALKQSSVVYNPIDKEYIQSFINNDKINDLFTIVLCGRYTPVKGYDRMIRVAKRLKDVGFSFQVNFIGEGEERENLQQLINSLELDDCVSLLGFKNPPYEEMAKADLFVSTSFTEGYPVNICEAICLGLPIIATRCTGTTEILGENGEYGMIAEQNEDSIFECIKYMIIDGDLLECYKQKAISASQKFSIGKTMNEIYDVL